MTVARARYERWCRFLLRAFPRRWRAHYATELLVVLLDLAPEGARRPDMKTAVDLLRSGWIVRWRSRPPVWRWVLYRGFGKRLPGRYGGWVADDIDGALFPLRDGTGFLVIMTVFWVLTIPSALPVAGAAMVVVVLSRFVFRGYFRRTARNHQFPTLHPAAWGPAEWTTRRSVGSEPRRRVRAGRWLTLTGAGLLAGAAALLTVPAVSEPAGVPASAALVVGAGTLAGALLLGRVRRLRGRPDQPARHLVDVPSLAPVVSTLLPAMALAFALAPLPLVAWVAGLVLATIAPSVLAAGLASGRWAGEGPPVALVDLARALRGRDRLVVDDEVALWSNPYAVTRPSERWTREQDGGPSPVA